MSRQDTLSVWTQTVSTHLPQISRPQTTVLAAWSFAFVLTQSFGCTSAALFLDSLWDQAPATVDQCLHQWCYDARDKHGRKRRDLTVTTCFAPLLR